MDRRAYRRHCAGQSMELSVLPFKVNIIPANMRGITVIRHSLDILGIDCLLPRHEIS